MSYKNVGLIFLFQVLAAVLAVLSFRWVPDRSIAAMLAATGFVLIGAYVVWGHRDWLNKSSSPLYWLAWVHLFIFSIPMLIVRLVFWGEDFSNIHIYKIPADQFHRFSEINYLLFMAATAWEGMRTWFKHKR